MGSFRGDVDVAQHDLTRRRHTSLDDTLRLSALTTLNLDERRLIRAASHISELCLRLQRCDIELSTMTFVIDTNFR